MVCNSYLFRLRNKVKTTLELKVQSMGLQDVISRILVPLEDEIDEKDGVKK